jgi:hypothetical protein
MAKDALSGEKIASIQAALARGERTISADEVRLLIAEVIRQRKQIHEYAHEASEDAGSISDLRHSLDKMYTANSRLVEENKALRPVAQSIADYSLGASFVPSDAEDGWIHCRFSCGAEYFIGDSTPEHDPNCIYLAARKAMGLGDLE